MDGDVGKKLEDWMETCYSEAERIEVKNSAGEVLYVGPIMDFKCIHEITSKTILDGVYFVGGKGYECVVG